MSGLNMCRRLCLPEHQVYTYDDSESPRAPRGRTSQPDHSPPDAVGLLNESLQRPKGDAELRAKVQEEQEELKLSRCLSDPGPKKDEDDDDGSFSW